MNNKLKELQKKFDEDENITGSRLANSLDLYLEEFTGVLKEKIKNEKAVLQKPVLKVVNFLGDIENEKNYTLKHVYPVLRNDKSIHMLKREDSVELIEDLNAGIGEALKNQSSSFIVAGYVFGNASYSECRDTICRKSYQAVLIDQNGNDYEVQYRLAWSDLIVKKNRYLWNMSKLYRDESPILYAPYSTRLLRMEINIEKILSIEGIIIKEVKLQLEDNNLEGKLLFGKQLMWNVNVETVESLQTVSPVGEMKLWKYEFSGLLKHQYIMPTRNSWRSFRLKVIDEKTVELIYENQLHSGEFLKVSIYEISDNDFEGLELFKTHYNEEECEIQPRVRSIADIKYEISKFSSYPKVRISGIESRSLPNRTLVRKFSSEESLYEKGRFGYPNTNKIFLVFSGDSKYVFFEDYANYVLGYLTYLYPEVGWEGVY